MSLGLALIARDEASTLPLPVTQGDDDYAPQMADTREKALRDVRETQARFLREQAAARKARREAFAKARRAGLSLRDIAEAADLHHSSIADIIAGKQNRSSG